MSHHDGAVTHGESMRELPLPGPVATPGGIKGGFRFTLSTRTWWWSPGVYMLLGFDERPTAPVPAGTRLLLRHIHPTDRRSVARAWTLLRSGESPVALGFHISGVDAVVRRVFVTASAEVHSNGTVTAVSGVLHLEATLPPAQRTRT